MAILFQKCEKIWSHIAHPKMSRTHAHPAHFSERILHAHAHLRPHIARVRVRTHLRNSYLVYFHSFGRSSWSATTLDTLMLVCPVETTVLNFLLKQCSLVQKNFLTIRRKKVETLCCNSSTSIWNKTGKFGGITPLWNKYLWNKYLVKKYRWFLYNSTFKRWSFITIKTKVHIRTVFIYMQSAFCILNNFWTKSQSSVKIRRDNRLLGCTIF